MDWRQLVSVLLLVALTNKTYGQVSDKSTRGDGQVSNADKGAERELDGQPNMDELAKGLATEAQNRLKAADQQQDFQPNIEQFLPKQTSLFQADAIDVETLESMDCHLRNLDYCYAGILASGQKALPETDDELNMRCDEMKAATSCLSAYNARCASFKVFALLAPFAELDRVRQTGLANQPVPSQIQAILLNKNVSTEQGGSNAPGELGGELEPTNEIRTIDLMQLCEPDSRESKQNKLLRARIFQLAKCINQRVSQLRPCIEDLKTAVQIFYEPARLLPMRPACCALDRFQHCAMSKLDNICGLSSLHQLKDAAASSGGGFFLRTIDKVCSKAAKHDSAYCQDVLPPSGTKVTPRRGTKASKLAKALDLISFVPN